MIEANHEWQGGMIFISGVVLGFTMVVTQDVWTTLPAVPPQALIAAA